MLFYHNQKVFAILFDFILLIKKKKINAIRFAVTTQAPVCQPIIQAVKNPAIKQITDTHTEVTSTPLKVLQTLIELVLDAPYWIEDGWIYPGMKVKCIDSRHIKVLPPREDGLLDSWYPRIQFGHYSQVRD